jgi:hypothetical protein
MATEQGQSLANQAEQAGQLAREASRVSPDAAAALGRAEQVAREGSDAAPQQPAQGSQAQQQVQQSMERAAASLAARQQQIQRDRDIAEAIGQMTEQQQQARETITEQAANLESFAGRDAAAAPAPVEVAAAAALERATEQFAQAQRATGEGAAQVSGQAQVANQPIREGLEAASQLSLGMPAPEMPLLPGDPIQMADAQPGQGETPSGEMAASGEPGQASADGPGQPSGESPAGQGEGQPASGGQASATPAPLGTGFVPSSPEATAQQIAGAQAMAQAAQTLAQAQAAGQSASPGAAQPGDSPSDSADPSGQGQSETPVPGESSSMASSGGVSVSGDTPDNPTPSEQALEMAPEAQGDSRTADNNADAELRERLLREEPWFAKLPPTLRNAIRASARRAPPRGYEERLRRYFESID